MYSQKRLSCEDRFKRTMLYTYDIHKYINRKIVNIGNSLRGKTFDDSYDRWRIMSGCHWHPLTFNDESIVRHRWQSVQGIQSRQMYFFVHRSLVTGFSIIRYQTDCPGAFFRISEFRRDFTLFNTSITISSMMFVGHRRELAPFSPYPLRRQS